MGVYRKRGFGLGAKAQGRMQTWRVIKNLKAQPCVAAMAMTPPCLLLHSCCVWLSYRCNNFYLQPL